MADIRDRRRIDSVFGRFRPDIVFHAAAHKHVHLMEENYAEAISNNIVGTEILVNAALQYGSKRFVAISTDKAVSPSGIMGASKRVASLLVRDAGRRSGLPFVVVRFGNVLGSRGSVVPFFKSQIERGGPVTITDPEMKRYFMTTAEAVHLVLQAGGLGKRDDLFVLNMGEPVRIIDLANDLIRLSGFTTEEISPRHHRDPRGRKARRDAVGSERGDRANRAPRHSQGQRAARVARGTSGCAPGRRAGSHGG